MVSQNLTKAIEAAGILNDAERHELCRQLNEPVVEQSEQAKQQQVRQALVERGLLEKQPPRGKDPERFRRWQPIPIKGKPLSETIIEERR